jgi:hypothetical protein
LTRSHRPGGSSWSFGRRKVDLVGAEAAAHHERAIAKREGTLPTAGGHELSDGVATKLDRGRESLQDDPVPVLGEPALARHPFEPEQVVRNGARGDEEVDVAHRLREHSWRHRSDRHRCRIGVAGGLEVDSTGRAEIDLGANALGLQACDRPRSATGDLRPPETTGRADRRFGTSWATSRCEPPDGVQRFPGEDRVTAMVLRAGSHDQGVCPVGSENLRRELCHRRRGPRGPIHDPSRPTPVDLSVVNPAFETTGTRDRRTPPVTKARQPGRNLDPACRVPALKSDGGVRAPDEAIPVKVDAQSPHHGASGGTRRTGNRPTRSARTHPSSARPTFWCRNHVRSTLDRMTLHTLAIWSLSVGVVASLFAVLRAGVRYRRGEGEPGWGSRSWKAASVVSAAACVLATLLLIELIVLR